MNLSNNQSEKKYLVHIIYAGAFLFAVLAVIGYLVWNKYEIASAAQAKKTKTLVCITEAQENYSQSWAAACNANAKETQDELTNCIISSKKRAQLIADADSYVNYKNLAANYIAQCKTAYGTPNSKSTCLLPASIAKSLNSGLQKSEKLCTMIS